MKNKIKVISALLIIICVICIAVFFISRANAFDITVKSNHSHTGANTVHPGSEITYNYTIKNNEPEEIAVTVKDVIPKNTEYVSGCENITKNKLRWELSIPSGESKTISYTIKVLDDMSLCDGKYVQNKSFKINGKKYASSKIYIERTFNKFDQEKIAFAIKSHTWSMVEGSELAKAIYNTAFSQTFELDGSAYEVLEQVYGSTKQVEENIEDNEESAGEEVAAKKVNLLEMIVPTLYGGEEFSKNPGKEFRGEKNNQPSSRDFITGDILVAQKDTNDAEGAKMYMYNGKEFVELLVESKKTNADELLKDIATYDRYVALRPSMVLDTLNHSEYTEKEELTLAQEAIVETAKSYLLRGYRMQYDDTRMTDGGEFRWQIDVKAPEDYTIDEWGYSNCAAFVLDVFKNSIGYETDMYSTKELVNEYDIRPYIYYPNGSETEDEKAAVEKEFNETLKPGDGIVVRYKNKSGGHAMLYIGNGEIIHSTGSNYDYTTPAETYEQTIRYLMVKDLFTPDTKRYVFSELSQLAIVRPLEEDDVITESADLRLGDMRGIAAEKLSSHKYGMTVNPGEEMTFTFRVYNSNEHEVSLNITDIVPENTTYVSGAEKLTGNNLSWNITVPADSTVEKTYTVKVNNVDTSSDAIVSGEGAFVGGISVKCADVKIKNAFGTEEAKKISTAIDESIKNKKSAIERANYVYEKVLGKENVFGTQNIADFKNELFEKALGYRFVLKNGSIYAAMVPDYLYGGNLYNSDVFEYKRVRLVREHNIIVGDVIFVDDGKTKNMYIYNGNEIIDLTSGEKLDDTKSFLEKLIGCKNTFAVLRPSMVN